MLIYDIEIRNAIPDARTPRLPDIRYCGGWTDYRGAGISVIGCYDYREDRYRVFCSDNLVKFSRLLQRHELIVGFNNHRFDDRILEAHKIEVPPDYSYDILTEVWRSLGLGPSFSPETHGGYGLDALARANFGLSKTGHGATAPIDWQRGHVGTVIDYCLQDIALTKKLLDRIIHTGELTNPKTSFKIRLRKPGAQQ